MRFVRFMSMKDRQKAPAVVRGLFDEMDDELRDRKPFVGYARENGL